MPEPLVDFPAEFTDRKWKEFEKKLKVSGTGIGKALRAMEKTAADLDKALVKARALHVKAKKAEDVDKTAAAVRAEEAAMAALPPLHVKHLKAVIAARSVVTATARKVKPTNAPAAHWLDEYEEELGRYYAVWKKLDVEDNRGLKFVVTDLAGRVDALQLHDRIR